MITPEAANSPAGVSYTVGLDDPGCGHGKHGDHTECIEMGRTPVS